MTVAHKSRSIIIIGATSVIAQHCARLWAAETDARLTLVARNADKLQQIATDLALRNPQCTIKTLASELLADSDIKNVLASTADTAPDIVLIAQGHLADQQACQDDSACARQTIELNALSPVLFAEAYLGLMLAQGKGTLAIIGSVAGDRGRKSNYTYGAAKALLDRFSQGLRHRLQGSKVNAVLIKPGPVNTPMAQQAKNSGALSLADPEAVARQMVSGIDKGKAVIYTPTRWRWIMMIIRHIPGWCFNRLNI